MPAYILNHFDNHVVTHDGCLEWQLLLLLSLLLLLLLLHSLYLSVALVAAVTYRLLYFIGDFSSFETVRMLI